MTPKLWDIQTSEVWETSEVFISDFLFTLSVPQSGISKMIASFYQHHFFGFNKAAGFYSIEV